MVFIVISPSLASAGATHLSTLTLSAKAAAAAEAAVTEPPPQRKRENAGEVETT
jgi:hypothetical protein